MAETNKPSTRDLFAEWAGAMFGENGQPGYTTGQLITLGGVDPETGEDATNAVTYMCLQASGRVSRIESSSR